MDKNYSDIEINDILNSYNNLYLDKYTYENPQFTINFIKNLLYVNAFSINTLNNINWVKAVFWYYKVWETITTPIFWYKNENLYRHISYYLLIKSLKEAKILNRSSWVGQFKINRWAVKYMEYSLVYINNLKSFKRFVWKIIICVSNKIGEPLLKNNIF